MNGIDSVIEATQYNMKWSGVSFNFNHSILSSAYLRTHGGTCSLISCEKVFIRSHFRVTLDSVLWLHMHILPVVLKWLQLHLSDISECVIPYLRIAGITSLSEPSEPDRRIINITSESRISPHVRARMNSSLRSSDRFEFIISRLTSALRQSHLASIDIRSSSSFIACARFVTPDIRIHSVRLRFDAAA